MIVKLSNKENLVLQITKVSAKAADIIDKKSTNLLLSAIKNPNNWEKKKNGTGKGQIQNNKRTTKVWEKPSFKSDKNSIFCFVLVGLPFSSGMKNKTNQISQVMD